MILFLLAASKPISKELSNLQRHQDNKQTMNPMWFYFGGLVMIAIGTIVTATVPQFYFIGSGIVLLGANIAPWKIREYRLMKPVFATFCFTAFCLVLIGNFLVGESYDLYLTGLLYGLPGIAALGFAFAF